MSGIFISQVGGAAGSPLSITVQTGDLIVVGSCAFLRTGTWYGSTIADDQGNTYQGGWAVEGFGAFGYGQCWYTYATGNGTIDVTLTAGGSCDAVRVGVYRGAGFFDQVSMYGAPNAVNNTGGITFADSLIVTFARDGGDTSSTGDTKRSSSGDCPLFDRNEVGPGNGFVQINDLVITMVFSSPVARPGGLQSQSALRSGLGYDDNEPAFFSGVPTNSGAPVNRPLTVSLPYTPLLGSLVVVAGAVNVDPGVFSIADTYGNVYTLQASGVGVGVNSVMWTTVVAHLPSAGHVFQVTMSVTKPSSSGIYQSASLAISEKVITGPPTAYAAYTLASISSSNPNSTLISQTAVGVPAGTYLIAFATYDSGESVVWTPKAGYTIQASWSFRQATGTQTNAARGALAALLDQTAPTVGDYDAEATVSVTGLFDGHNGSIIMLAITLPAPAGNSVIASCSMSSGGGGGGGGSSNCRTAVYLWQHSVAPQVEIIADRNDDWTDCGTPGLKFFQGFKLDADTFGNVKNIQVRDADSGALHAPQPYPIIHSGRQTLPYSFVTPFLAHSVRRESLDAVAWRKFGISYVWGPSPEFTYTWITQRTSHGLSGFHFIQRMLFAYASTAAVTLTVTAFDGVSPSVITLPSTGGLYQKVVIIFTFNKGLLFQYSAISTSPFQIWLSALESIIGVWGRNGAFINYPLLGTVGGDKAEI